MSINTQIKETQTDFLKFIDDRQDYFIALDLNLRVPGNSASQDSSWSGSDDKRAFTYNYMQTKVKNLSEAEQKIYDKVVSHYKDEQAYLANSSSKIRAENDQLNEQRQAEAKRKREEKMRQLAEMQNQIRLNKEREMVKKDGDPYYGIDIDQDPNDMPDSIEKYKTILLRARDGKGKFIDRQFKAGKNDPSALGDKVFNKLGGNVEWVRASESEVHKKPYQGFNHDGKVCLFEDGADCNDISQGRLGDCYLLSSMAVLGKRTNRMFYSVLKGDVEKEWEETGCVCIEFWDQGKEDYIVIDDFLPTSGE